MKNTIIIQVKSKAFKEWITKQGRKGEIKIINKREVIKKK